MFFLQRDKDAMLAQQDTNPTQEQSQSNLESVEEVEGNCSPAKKSRMSPGKSTKQPPLNPTLPPELWVCVFSQLMHMEGQARFLHT